MNSIEVQAYAFIKVFLALYSADRIGNPLLNYTEDYIDHGSYRVYHCTMEVPDIIYPRFNLNNIREEFINFISALYSAGFTDIHYFDVDLHWPAYDGTNQLRVSVYSTIILD